VMLSAFGMSSQAVKFGTVMMWYSPTQTLAMGMKHYFAFMICKYTVIKKGTSFIFMTQKICTNCKRIMIKIVIWVVTSCYWLIMMGWDYVSELRPPTGLLFIPQVICGMEGHGDDDAGCG
jgi:hypothetical protein